MSTSGNFLTIIIKIAKEIGIMKATIFPVIWPGETEPPNIKRIPKIAIAIQLSVNFEIFSFKKIYPKIARKRV